MLAAGASLLVATSCDTQDKEGGYSVSNRKGINSEGIAAHEVERARQEFHVDGSDVTVCVISDSIRYLRKAKYLQNQDVTVLPEQSGIPKDDPDVDEETDRHKDKGEGTAMLEIVHSIAPGAKLMFATHGKTPRDMFNNIIALSSKGWGCHIIVDDHEFFSQSPFQDDEVSRAVNEVTANGILYITSAGNRGNTRAGTSAAWEGYFKPGRTLNDGGAMHVFANERNGGYNSVLGECGREGGMVHVRLFWNDPIPSPGGESQPAAGLSDYNLWAFGEKEILRDKFQNCITTARLTDKGKCKGTMACLVDPEKNEEKGEDECDLTVGKKPCRHICFPAPNRTDTNPTSIVITKVGGKADFLHLDLSVQKSKNKNGCRLQYRSSGVISGHHGAKSAFSVASKSALGVIPP